MSLETGKPGSPRAEIHKSNSLLLAFRVAKVKTVMFFEDVTKRSGRAAQKIKSRGYSMFNILNEFIIERILFFGNTTNRVKEVESK